MTESVKQRIKLFFTLRVEHERFSKLANMVEGLGFYLLIVFLVYRLLYVEITPLESIFRTIVLIYIIGIGPLLHGNPPSEIGIGNILNIKADLFNRKKPGIIAIVAVLVLLSIVLINDPIEEVRPGAPHRATRW
jgi:hypothetical protein